MRKASVFLLLLLVSCVLPAQVTGGSASNSSPLEAVRGNWFDSKHGGWTVGIYDSLAIVDNRICDVRLARSNGKSIELTLQDRGNGTTQVLAMTPQRDGICMMKQGKNKRKLTHSRQQPMVTADKGYDNFFNPDTATIQGYIVGYNKRLGFETGLIYLEDIITNTDIPMAVPIAPDGTFACKLPMKHPMVMGMVLNNRWLLFFVEPGKTQTMCVNAEDLTTRRQSSDIPLLFMGDGAHISYLVRELNNKISYHYAKLKKAQLEQTPAQFKESFPAVVAQWQHVGDSLASVYAASQKAVSMIRHHIALKEGETFCDFLSSRSYWVDSYPDNTVLKVKEENDYYDFLRRMPLDDPEVLACYDAGGFVNELRFMNPIMTTHYRHAFTSYMSMTKEEKAEARIKYEERHRSKLDSVMASICGSERSFLWKVAGVYYVKDGLQYHFATHDAKRKYVDMMKEWVKDYPFLVGQMEELYETHMAKARSNSYALPEGKATDIFRNIIKDHAGKVLFIDFWATTCGPCRAGISATAELRRKYKDHPDFKFIYITADNESPLADYNRYVEENLNGEASYRVSSTEFAYLRQLFKFNGIPHYELVEPDGTIYVEEIGTWNLSRYLDKRFPLKDN